MVNGTRIVVVGSANIDLMLTVPHLPRPGETIAGVDFRTVPGGKGANQAVAAARLGAPVTFIACVGDDDFGRMAMAALTAEGITTTEVRRNGRAATGVAMVLTDHAGENCIALTAGANAELGPADIDAAAGTITTASLVVCQLETPIETVRRVIETARRAGVPVLLNPAPAAPLDDVLLHGLTFLVPNALEAGVLTGIVVEDTASAARAGAALVEKGVQTVLITRGADGVVVVDRNGWRSMAATAAIAVDTTGAGDTFIGAFVAAWTRSPDVSAAVAFGQRAAAFSVARRGAQAAMPTRQDLDR